MNKHIHWRITLGVGIAYALATGLMALPVSLHLSQRLLGNSADSWLFYWNNWWLEQAIVQGRNWLFTPYMFYPQGASLVAHANSLPTSLLALIIKPLIGSVAAYNLALLIGLWMSAMGMFLLVYEITRRSSAALLADFVFAFAPYHLTQALGLALVSLLSRRKEAWFWLLSTGFWMVLAAGPVLRLNGTLYPHIPMPYRFIGHPFPVSAIRAPDRFNLLVAFSLAVSAGLGAAYLVRQRRWLLVPLVFLVLVEYLCIPLQTWGLPPASPFFQQMAQEQALYGVVDYPMGYTFGKKRLYYQTLHGKPMVEGHIARYTPEDYVFIASNPLLRTFYQVAEKPVRLPRDTFSGVDIPVSALGPALRALETSGVRYILLHKPYLNTDLEAHFRRLLPPVPTYEDSTLAVYDVSRPLPVYYDGFPAPLTPDAALARFDVQPDNSGTEWQLQIITILLAPHASPLPCQIRLIGENGSVLETPITFFETLPAQEGQKGNEGNWAAGDLDLQEITLSLPQAPETGVYRWNVTCPEAADYTAPETLNVYPDGRASYLRSQVNVRYGDFIQLLGYRWRTTGTDLQMNILWETLKAPRTDYKVFVHLLNASGEIVRQYDAIPCNWQCPTSQWHAGDIVPDQAVISLRGLPPEEYRLAVGLYHLATQERLPARGPEGELYPDAYFVLPDAFLISTEFPETSVYPVRLAFSSLLNIL